MGSIPQVSKLFQPLKVGNLTLSSRVVLAPLTRLRADDSHVPLPMVAEYYSQRASVPGTLLISEATYVSPNSSGYPNTPGVWNDDQMASWRRVTDAVHAQGSYIFAQLWALGRAAQPAFKTAQGTGDVVSSSATRMDAEHAVPRALTEAEILEYIADFATAAKNAVAAGFDGVEIHAANGYLIDQFIQDVVNTRSDAWGGSIEKRARFALEIAGAVSQAIGPERTGIRLSPWNGFQAMGMADPLPQFSYLTEKLAELKLAYLHLVESRVNGAEDRERTDMSDPLMAIWNRVAPATSPLILAGGFTAPLARETIDVEYKDLNVAVSFGRHFISNPDLVYRIQNGIEFNKYNRATFYAPKLADGYIDYPFSEQFLKESPQKSIL